MTKELLFETSPIEDEDSKKRKPSSRKKKHDDNERPKSEPVDYASACSVGYIASLDYTCERCGCTVTDLAEVRKSDWLVVCGWGCGRQWSMDPIPGVLDALKPNDEDFVLRDGRFRGKTFSEVWGDGGDWYVRGLAKLGGKTVASRAASAWLARKGY